MNLRLLFLTTTFVVAVAPLQAMFCNVIYEKAINAIQTKSEDHPALIYLTDHNIELFGQQIAAEILQEGLKRVGKSIESVKNVQNMSLLHGAAFCGYVGVIKLLLSLPNAQTLSMMQEKYGQTPLHVASWGGYVEVARVFLTQPYAQKFAAMQDLFGNTPLHIASLFGKKEIVELILALPDVYNLTAITNNDGQTAYEVAATPELKEILSPYTSCWDAMQ